MKKQIASIFVYTCHKVSVKAFVLIFTSLIYVCGCSEPTWTTYHLYNGPKLAPQEVAVVLVESYSPVSISEMDGYKLDSDYKGYEYHLLPGYHLTTASLSDSHRMWWECGIGGLLTLWERGEPIKFSYYFRKGHVYELGSETEYRHNRFILSDEFWAFDDIANNLEITWEVEVAHEPSCSDTEGKWWMTIIDKGTIEEMAPAIADLTFKSGLVAPPHWRILVERGSLNGSGTHQQTKQFKTPVGKVLVTATAEGYGHLVSSGLDIPIESYRPIDIRPAQPNIRMPDFRMPDLRDELFKYERFKYP